MSSPDERPLVSVVTPVYDGEDYLEECVESVLAQTYDRWDYTILNNCSTDRSLEIAQSYAARDARIRVVDNEEFLGQTANLNKALTLISPQSRYAKMVLADDWMFPECLERMVEVAEEHPSVGVVSAYRLEETRVSCAGLPYPSPVTNGREVARAALVEDLFVFGTPSNLLYRSDIVRARDPFYHPRALHEDTEACYEILEEYDLGFVHQVLTFTRRQNESLAAARKVYDAGHRLDKLITTYKYAPRFLSPGEAAECLKQAERNYYRFLGVRSLEGTGPEFWAYHRDALEVAGYTFRQGEYRRERLRAALIRVRNPLRVTRAAIRRITKR